MTITNADVNRCLTGGEQDAILRLAASEIPFVGSVLDLNAAGFAEKLIAGNVGQPFAGIARGRVCAKDHPGTPANGNINVPAVRGVFFFRAAIAGIAQADAIDQRAVFAADDNTFTLTPNGTAVGIVWDLDPSGEAIILAATHGHHGVLGLAHRGIKTLPATGNQTLTTADAGKLIQLTATAAQQVTLPDPAKTAGKSFKFKKTTGGTFTVTIVGAAGLIDGAANTALITGNNKGLVLESDGTGYWITSAV